MSFPFSERDTIIKGSFGYRGGKDTWVCSPKGLSSMNMPPPSRWATKTPSERKSLVPFGQHRDINPGQPKKTFRKRRKK